MQYYTSYSPAFRETISQLYTEYSLWEVDVTLLQDKGKEAYGNQDYEHAVHYIEAALQLELEPFFRYHLLNLLGVYYMRAGDTESAKTVQACLVERDMIHMYNIIPQRGF
jgi:Flp pilus assembly protein TadD